MKYKFDDSSVKVKAPTFPISAQVDNVELEDISYSSGVDSLSNSYESIDFKFTRKLPTGTVQVMNEKMFSINESKIRPRMNETLDEAIKRTYSDFTTKMVHIAEAFGITREQIELALEDVKTFREMTEAYSSLVKAAALGQKVYLKVISSKGFTSLPLYPNFIQNMNDGECTLKYNNYELKRLEENTAPSNGVHEESDWIENDVDESEF